MVDCCPVMMDGGLSVDDRGSLRYINDLDFSSFGIKRFYQVDNNESNHTRAYHGHLKENKIVYVPRGSAIIVGIPLSLRDNGTPFISKFAKVCRHVLSSDKSQALWIPAGYANGFKTLNKDTIVMFFSDLILDDSKGDDYRFSLDALDNNPFEIEVR